MKKKWKILICKIYKLKKLKEKIEKTVKVNYDTTKHHRKAENRKRIEMKKR